MTIKRLLVLFSLMLVLSCDSIYDFVGLTKDDSITSELFKDVVVTLAGTVISVDTGEPLADMTVQVMEYESGSSSGTSLSSSITDAAGTFSITEGVTIEVDEKEYYLVVSDSQELYYTNNATLIYAVRDSELTGYEIRMIPKNPQSLTTVQGRVFDGLSRDTALEGVEITLTSRFDSTLTYSTQTDSNGDWSLEAEVSNYRISYDGSSLASNYIVEYDDYIFQNTQTNNLGSHYLVPVLPGGEFRVVLQWDDPQNYELQMYLDIFSSEMPTVNTLGPAGSSILIPSRYTINPGSGFAQDSSYWPNTVSPGYHREYIFANANSDPYQVGGENVILFDRAETQGIEVITFKQANPLDAFPERLTYYYNYSEDGSIVSHYPVGVYNLMVQLHQQNNENIYDSQASVKLYQGSDFMGSFDIGDFNPNLGESNKFSWDVLFIEAGFTATSPNSASQCYLRPVPFFSTSMENEAWDQPPFLKQSMYSTGSALEGTDAFGTITALYYDTNWGLFVGTESNGIRALYFDGAQHETFSNFTLTDPVIDIEILGEPFILVENSSGIGDVYDVEGNLVSGGAPEDINCMYSNTAVSGSLLVAGGATGLHTFGWIPGWVTITPAIEAAGNANAISSVTDLFSSFNGSALPELVIANGIVYYYDGTEYIQLASSMEPPVGASGTLVRGGFYGYVDSLLDGQWQIFWGFTDANEIYVTACREFPVASGTYEYGTPQLIADLQGVTIYDIEALARPGEDVYGGQPIFGTQAGIFKVSYNHDAGQVATQDNLNTVFSISLTDGPDSDSIPDGLYRFFPANLPVRDLVISYETTFAGTEGNGVIHSLGGMF